jgi:hypothetical protein
MVTLDEKISKLVFDATSSALRVFFANYQNSVAIREEPVELQVLRRQKAKVESSTNRPPIQNAGTYISQTEAEQLFAEFIRNKKTYYDLGKKVNELRKERGAFAAFVQEIENYAEQYGYYEPFLKKGTLSKFGTVIQKYVEDWGIPVEELYPVPIFDLYDLQNEGYVINAEEAIRVISRLKQGETTVAIKQSYKK